MFAPAVIFQIKNAQKCVFVLTACDLESRRRRRQLSLILIRNVDISGRRTLPYTSGASPQKKSNSAHSLYIQ